MATQKETGHDADALPKLQKLPGRSSNKLQGRLYSNAGRGYDRESLQKMSTGAGPALVTSEEASTKIPSDTPQEQTQESAAEKAVLAHDVAINKNSHPSAIKNYIAGAVLFFAGIFVGNIVIPLFTNNDSTSDVTGISEISSITSINGDDEGGCSIASLKDEAEGCSAGTNAPTESGITNITNLGDLSSEDEKK